MVTLRVKIQQHLRKLNTSEYKIITISCVHLQFCLASVIEKCM